jgi:hypothetical protein
MDEQPEQHEGEVHMGMTMGGGAAASVERGLNDIRLAVLGVLVTIGLSFFFGVSGPWWERGAWGLGSFAVACLLIWRPRSRRVLMGFMHRLTGH